jgi:hypothetical protein
MRQLTRPHPSTPRKPMQPQMFCVCVCACVRYVFLLRASMASKSMAAGSVEPMRWMASVAGGTRCNISQARAVTACVWVGVFCGLLCVSRGLCFSDTCETLNPPTTPTHPPTHATPLPKNPPTHPPTDAHAVHLRDQRDRLPVVGEVEVVSIGPDHQEAHAPPVQDERVRPTPGEGVRGGGGAGVEGLVEDLFVWCW